MGADVQVLIDVSFHIPVTSQKDDTVRTAEPAKIAELVRIGEKAKIEGAVQTGGIFFESSVLGEILYLK